MVNYSKDAPAFEMEWSGLLSLKKLWHDARKIKHIS